MEKKLGIIGCKNTTKELIEGLLLAGVQIDQVITISPEKGKSQKVAGYCDLQPYLQEKGIPCYVAHAYSLKSEIDKQEIAKLNLDILLTTGWQRLIPEWLLKILSVGAFGMHGASKPLPFGRGRSPLNWSLIQDKRMFFTHLFKYNPGVDDGDIVGVQLFDITPFDTCATLHYKNLLSMLKLVQRELPNILEGSVNTYPQRDVEPSFYPKRTAEDGIIFWEDTTLDIYNLIRAVTHPFPGAFTFLNINGEQHKVMIWKAIPFDSHIRWDQHEPGEICHVFSDGNFIVKTGDTSILVQEYEGLEMTNEYFQNRFNNNNITRKVWDNLPY